MSDNISAKYYPNPFWIYRIIAIVKG